MSFFIYIDKHTRTLNIIAYGNEIYTRDRQS
jgi:hypothetical protein